MPTTHPTLRHVDPTRRRGPLYKAFIRAAGLRPMLWVSRTVSWKLDPRLLRWTGGRISSALTVPAQVLETRGARTGLPRQSAVIYFHDGDRVTIVPSQAGAPTNPAWYHNALAHPEVTFGGVPFRAEEVHDEAERTRLWALADNVYPQFARFRVQAARHGRTIPILQLVPRP